jgi:hypothetical protein
VRFAAERLDSESQACLRADDNEDDKNSNQSDSGGGTGTSSDHEDKVGVMLAQTLQESDH